MKILEETRSLPRRQRARTLDCANPGWRCHVFVPRAPVLRLGGSSQARRRPQSGRAFFIHPRNAPAPRPAQGAAAPRDAVKAGEPGRKRKGMGASAGVRPPPIPSGGASGPAGPCRRAVLGARPDLGCQSFSETQGRFWKPCLQCQPQAVFRSWLWVAVLWVFLWVFWLPQRVRARRSPFPAPVLRQTPLGTRSSAGLVPECAARVRRELFRPSPVPRSAGATGPVSHACPPSGAWGVSV